MTNRNKRKSLVDRDNVKSDYCCSFIRAPDGDDALYDLVSKEKTAQEISLDGTEIKEFYERLLEQPSCNSQKTESSSKRKRWKHIPRLRSQQQSNDSESSLAGPFTDKKQQNDSKPSKTSCFKRIKTEDSVELMINEDLCTDSPTGRLTMKLLVLSTEGNFEDLKIFIKSVRNRYDFMEILNGVDHYGWTSVMCAAAAGHLHVVQYLINAGCLFKDIVENTGRDVIEICRQKGRGEILELLTNYYKSNNSPGRKHVTGKGEEMSRDEGIVCEICSVEYSKSKQKEHFGSMVHIFKDKSKTLGMSYGIPDHNKGFQMLLRSGWDVNQGLGPEGSGPKNPIKTILKRDRLGLGVESNSKKRVSHFSAFDHSAVKQVQEKRVQKKSSKRTYERKIMKEKAWERNMRHYMSSNF